MYTYHNNTTVVYTPQSLSLSLSLSLSPSIYIYIYTYIPRPIAYCQKIVGGVLNLTVP